MERCQKCIIPDSFPNVTIEHGLCSFCRQSEANKPQARQVKGHDQLLALLKSRRAAAYDCAVPLSGGKDSSYILYYVVRELKLKPLALFFDNGFVTEMAKRNVERMCSVLGVDLVVGRASPYRHKLMREALLMSRCLGQFVKYCGNCENNLRSFTLNESNRRNIPFLIWGATDFEGTVQSFKASADSKTFRLEWGTFKYMASQTRQHVQKLFGSDVAPGRKLQAFVHALKYMFYCVCDNVANKAPVGWQRFNPFLQVTFARTPVQAVYFYDYIQYDPYRHIETLRRELQWEAPEGQEIRHDCKVVSLKNMQQLMATGLTASGFTLATLVRNGLLDRQEALKRERLLCERLVKDCREVAEQLGVDVEWLQPRLDYLPK